GDGASRRARPTSQRPQRSGPRLRPRGAPLRDARDVHHSTRPRRESDPWPDQGVPHPLRALTRRGGVVRDIPTMGNEEFRAELASVAASLRAYLETQRDSGATGIPSKPRPRTAVTPSPSPSPSPSSAPTSGRALSLVQAEVAACTKCALHSSRT